MVEFQRDEILSHIQSQKQEVRKALRRKSKSDAVESPDEFPPKERQVHIDHLLCIKLVYF